jgi:hypothetical protein
MREKRLHTRFSVEDLDVQTSTIVSTDVEIYDISPTGVSIVCARSLGIGKEYTLKFDVGRGPAVPVRAVAKWEMPMGCRRISATENVLLHLAGMEFRDVLTDKVVHVINFIKEIVEVRDKRLKGIRFRISTREKAILDCVETYSVKLMSLSGMLIETRHALSAENTFPMQLFLPDDDAPIHFRGKTASSQEVLTGGLKHYRTGIEFSEMKREDKVRLKAFLQFL